MGSHRRVSKVCVRTWRVWSLSPSILHNSGLSGNARVISLWFGIVNSLFVPGALVFLSLLSGCPPASVTNGGGHVPTLGSPLHRRQSNLQRKGPAIIAWFPPLL